MLTLLLRIHENLLSFLNNELVPTYAESQTYHYNMQ